MTAESIGADQVWAGTGAIQPQSGTGIGVAVIDSGVDITHASMRNRVVVNVDFTGSGDPSDHYGHGTHIASIIAGLAGNNGSEYKGIAYGASIINLRALGDDGSGTASNVIEAIDWAVKHRNQYNIRIINLSLGAPVLQPFRDDPLCEAAERAVRAGILVVASAGNNGQASDGSGKTVIGGITSPGNDPDVLTVGAIDNHYTGRAVRRHGGAVEQPRADGVRHGAEAGRGRAGRARAGGRGGRFVSDSELPAAARERQRRERLHAAVGHEPGGGGGERRGGAAV